MNEYVITFGSNLGLTSYDLILLAFCPLSVALGTTVSSLVNFLNSKPRFVPSEVPPDNGDPEGAEFISTEQILKNYNEKLRKEYEKVVNNWKSEFLRLVYIGLVLGLVIALYFIGAFTENITTLARILALCILIGYQAPRIWQLQERLIGKHIENKIDKIIKLKIK